MVVKMKQPIKSELKPIYKIEINDNQFYAFVKLAFDTMENTEVEILDLIHIDTDFNLPEFVSTGQKVLVKPKNIKVRAIDLNSSKDRNIHRGDIPSFPLPLSLLPNGS